MKKMLFSFLGCVFLSTVCVTGAEKIDVVILAGQNNHKWQETTPLLKKILEQTGRFNVRVMLDPKKLTEQTFAETQVLVSNWNNWGAGKKDSAAAARWSDELKTAYVEFVKNGGGHVMIHAGSSSFFDWADYQEICCTTWKLGQTGHGPIDEFEVRVAAPEHSITKGIEQFKATDELWHRPGIQPDVQILTEAYSSVTKSWEPNAMVSQFGKGRCFALLLGHGAEQMQSTEFKTLFTRGTEWAGSGRVASSDTK